MSLLTLEAKLERLESTTPWGFRMQGGKDFSSPLTIQRVNPGSLASKCGLQTGDIILRIGIEDTGPLRHKEAQNAIVGAGNRLDLLLQRGGGGPLTPGGYETIQIPIPAPSFNCPSPLPSPGGQTQNYNTAPQPFKPAYDEGLSIRTGNITLSPLASSASSPSISGDDLPPPPPPAAPSSSFSQAQARSNIADFRKMAEKYAEPADPPPPPASFPQPAPKNNVDFRKMAEKYAEPADPPAPSFLQPAVKNNIDFRKMAEKYSEPADPPAPSFSQPAVKDFRKMAEKYSEPADPPPPSSSFSKPTVGSNQFRNVAEKYAEPEPEEAPSVHQSRSFKYLQGLMESGQEAPTALKTVTPPALNMRAQSPATQNAQVEPPAGPSAVIGQSQPGRVKAIMSQRYNTPIGLYSNNEVMTQFESQFKLLVNPEDESGDAAPREVSDGLPLPPPPVHDLPPPPPHLTSHTKHTITRNGPAPGAPPVGGIPRNGAAPGAPVGGMGGNTIKYIPSETFKMIQESEKGLKKEQDDKTPAHSLSFLHLKKQLDSPGVPSAPSPGMKPSPMGQSFSPKPAASPAPMSPAAPPAAPAPRPAFPPPNPAGSGGAKRGMAGQAVMNQAGTGRIPICHSCSIPIRGPFVTALGNCWCPDCFICANPQCKCKLFDIGFVEENGKLYCEKDYEQYMAPKCTICGKSIIGECVNAMNKQYHPECFTCVNCKQPIGGNGQFHIEDGKSYCEKCWGGLFQTMCAACDFPVEPGDRWVEAMGKNFHAECFNCSTCQCSLEGQAFVARAGKAFCKKHAR